MLTAIIKIDLPTLRKRFARAGAPYLAAAKFRTVRGSPELLAVQHPTLARLGRGGILGLCQRVGVPLQFVEDTAAWK